MKTTKRKEFIKFLVNLGLDVETASNFIKCYYKDKPLFAVSDDRQFQSEITEYLESLDGELPYKIYSEVRKYASRYIEERNSEYEIEIEKEGKNRPNWMTRWLGEAVRDCERENKLENDFDSVFHRIESLEDGKKYYLKSLLSGIDEEYSYINIRSTNKGYTLTTKEAMSGYQTEFSKSDIEWLVKDLNVNFNDFEIIEVESDYEAGRQENL